MFESGALILAVKRHPCLWMSWSEEYLRKDLKEKAWDDIGKELFAGWESSADKKSRVAEIKKKWSNVRDCYRRDIQLLNDPSNTKRRKYIYSDLLTFLDPVLKRKIKNVDENNSETLISNEEIVYDESVAQNTKREQEYVEECSDEETETNPVAKSTIPDVKLLPQMENFNIFKNIHDVRSLPLLPPIDQDGDFYFILSCFEEMRNLSSLQKMELKIGIMELLKRIKFSDVDSQQNPRVSSVL